MVHRWARGGWGGKVLIGYGGLTLLEVLLVRRMQRWFLHPTAKLLLRKLLISTLFLNVYPYDNKGKVLSCTAVELWREKITCLGLMEWMGVF